MAGAVGRAGRGGGAGGRELAVRPEQPGQAGRPDDHRHRKPLRRRASTDWSRVGGAVQRPRQQSDLGEGRLVAAQRALVLGAAIGEIEHHPRQDLLRLMSQRRHAVAAPAQLFLAHWTPTAVLPDANTGRRSSPLRPLARTAERGGAHRASMGG